MSKSTINVKPRVAPASAAAEPNQRISWRHKFPPHFIRPDEMPSGGYARFKFAFDFVLAILLLIPAIPLMILAGCLIKLSSRGPMFYVQVRLGRHGRPYRLFKIRSMYYDCERVTGAVWSTTGDPRITPIGRFLRKTHLDELPQLFNVLRGEMSLVGPRPERPEIIPALEEAIPGYRQRLQVRPGVTGLAQCQLAPDTDMSSVRRKLSYDLYYVRRRGFWLDFRLIVCTAFKCIGMGYRTQRQLFALPHPDHVEKVSGLPFEEPIPKLQPI
jgi:lipopolysaccharide/colanic/teichoic acid biosynthesis glycosyltransferase